MKFFAKGKVREELPPLEFIRERCINHLGQMRPDHMRRLNPTPYKVTPSRKIGLVALPHETSWNHNIYLLMPIVTSSSGQVSVSAKLYDFIHFLWLNEAPVGELQ